MTIIIDFGQFTLGCPYVIYSEDGPKYISGEIDRNIESIRDLIIRNNVKSAIIKGECNPEIEEEIKKLCKIL